MAVVGAAVQLQTGFPDTHLVADVQQFDLREHQPMSSPQVVEVVLGLPQTR
jgi:acyl-coenzyme A synthetase/AMP-(fatty) acid ligase